MFLPSRPCLRIVKKEARGYSCGSPGNEAFLWIPHAARGNRRKKGGNAQAHQGGMKRARFFSIAALRFFRVESLRRWKKRDFSFKTAFAVHRRKFCFSPQGVMVKMARK